jgi:hypothetical protein
MILSCILLCLVLMVYSFAGYPALMALMARLRPKPWQARVQSSAHEGLSVVLCVHNAATLIRRAPPKFAGMHMGWSVGYCGGL